MEFDILEITTRLTNDLLSNLSDLDQYLRTFDRTMRAYSEFIADAPYNVAYNSYTNELIPNQCTLDQSSAEYQNSIKRLTIHASVTDKTHKDILESIRVSESIEAQIRVHKPEYQSQILSRVNELSRIRSTYTVPGHN